MVGHIRRHSGFRIVQNIVQRAGEDLRLVDVVNGRFPAERGGGKFNPVWSVPVSSLIFGCIGNAQ